MPKFSVKWTEAAREDYREIRAYLGEQAPWYVVELVLRKIVVGNYLLFYRVLEKQRVVRVVRMFHGAMNVGALL